MPPLSPFAFEPVSAARPPGRGCRGVRRCRVGSPLLRSPCGRLLERAAGLKGASIFEDGHRGIRYGKRPLLIVAAAAAAAALAVAGAGAPPATVGQAAADQQPPNVVVITTDDQTLKSMRVMDNVNSLIGGNRGTTFQNSFVNFSLCCPSRATFLTGQYMHNHGVRTNQPPDGGFERFLELHGDNNLAVWLQDSGYHTAMIGKTLNGYAGDIVPDGWSEWYASTPNDQEVYDYTLNENGIPVHYGTDPADFKQDVLTAKAVDFVDRRAPRGDPFFLWLTYTAPHVGAPQSAPDPQPPFNCHGAARPAPRHADAFDSEPLPRPPNFNEADVSDKPAGIRNLPLLSRTQITDLQRKYRCELESLLSVDEGVEEVVRELNAENELDETLIVYTSDNAFFHGEHRVPSGKMRIYEESIRVPLLIRGPGVPQGVTVGDLAINADLAPTILDAANADPGLVMDGRSLIPVANQPGIDRGRALLIEEPSFEAIRTERYLFAEHRGGARELYDLLKDPFELRSRHADPAYNSVKTQLAGRLHQLEECAGASCRLRSSP
jgi:N-acetylglucosamine-6-sulfatase